MASIVAKARFLSYDIEQLISDCGADILASDGMEYEKTQLHHDKTTCFEHSVAVAYLSVWIASVFKINVDTTSLIRGALLHDYYLYQKSMNPKDRTKHSVTHAKTACRNANRDFWINKIERDIIVKHMYPLTPKPPLYKESVIVCIADKLSAIMEKVTSITSINPPGVKTGKRLS